MKSVLQKFDGWEKRLASHGDFAFTHRTPPRQPLVCSNGEVKWNLSEIEVPTVEHYHREDAIEIQDIRELGMGWARFVDDRRAFLPAWQDMELASPFPDEPVSQINADILLEPGPSFFACGCCRFGTGSSFVSEDLLLPCHLAQWKLFRIGMTHMLRARKRDLSFE